MFPKMGRVILAYESAYPDPLTLKAGDHVTVGRRDTQWPGFVWCTDRAGQGGWVPDSILERQGEQGILRRDYDATELTAAVGEQLTVNLEESGWLWCTNARGQNGWIPADNVETVV